MNTKGLTSAKQEEKHQILSEAAHWLTLMDCNDLNKEQQAQLDLWQQKSAKHQQIWQAAQNLHQTLGNLPKHQTFNRRDLMRCVAYLCFLGPSSYAGYQYTPWRKITADYVTHVGEQQHVHLEDGSQLWLNTNTMVSTELTPQHRKIILHSGEIYIKTNHSQHTSPFKVETPLGSIQALGTQFNTRYDANSDQALISVQQHKVKITPADNSAFKIVASGQLASLKSHTVQLVETANLDPPLWVQGELAADKLPLATFLTELNRYRLGIIQCHPKVAQLSVSGLFQLANPDEILQLLQQTLPIEIKSLSRYWLRVGPNN